MRLGTVTQLVAVHGAAICTSPGVCLQRPLETHDGARVRKSVLGHSSKNSVQGHILDRSPTAALGAAQDKKGIELGLTTTTSDADEEAPPLPPVGFSQRPRPVSLCAHGKTRGPEGHIVAIHGPENEIHWI